MGCPAGGEFPGGAVRAGEEPEAAVRREVAEETGLDVSDVAAEKVLTYKREDPNDDNNYFMVVYKFELDADESMGRGPGRGSRGLRVCGCGQNQVLGRRGHFSPLQQR